MYGFVNLLVATAELLRGGEGETAEAILEEDDRGAFARDADGITWRGERYTDGGADRGTPADLHRVRLVLIP